MKKIKLIPLVCILFVAACCKVVMTFEQVKVVKFSNFNGSEIDTFYALPVLNDSIIPFANYNDYLQTSDANVANLTKTQLQVFSNLEIVLKDTSKRYLVSTTKFHSEKIGNGRCAGSNTLIDSISVNGITYKNDGTIQIVK